MKFEKPEKKVNLRELRHKIDKLEKLLAGLKLKEKEMLNQVEMKYIPSERADCHAKTL